VEIKCQLNATEVFISDIIVCSTCFGHHYPLHQELKSIIQWLLPVVFGVVVFKFLVSCGAGGYVSRLENHSTKHHRQQPLYNTLQLLIMDIMLPKHVEQAIRSAIKPLLHLVGILFPHISEEFFFSICPRSVKMTCICLQQHVGDTVIYFTCTVLRGDWPPRVSAPKQGHRKRGRGGTQKQAVLRSINL